MLRWVFLSLSVFTILASGCARKKASEATYLLPWADSQGRYQLQEITISTLTSTSEVRGQAAEIYFQPVFNDSGFKGHLAQPKLTKSGHVYIPSDVESSLALTVYAQFERIYQYEQRMGFSSQLRWPRQIGVELNLNSGDGSEHNNAHYFTGLDVIGLLPYSMAGVPFAVNQGIVSHENFHAHFQSEVINPLQAQVGLNIVSALEGFFYGAVNVNINTMDVPQSPKFLNDIVLRGWNEGLADFFAAIYTGQAEFFQASMPAISKARAVDGELAPTLAGGELKVSAEGVAFDRSQLVNTAYGQGTAIARILHRMAESGVEPPAQFLTRVMNHLSDIPAAIKDSYQTDVLDFDRVLPILLKDFPLTPGLCADLINVVSKNTYSTGFPACSNH